MKELVFSEDVERKGGVLEIRVYKLSEDSYLRVNTIIIGNEKASVEQNLTKHQYERLKQTALAFKGIKRTN